MSLHSFNVKEFGAGNERVVFFFCGMGTRIGLYRLPIKRLVAAGFHVVAIDFEPWVVRDGEPETWLQLGANVSREVGRHIKAAQAHGVRDFSTFGVSMGTLMAIRCAADYAAISKVVINMTYGSVAENIWTWWLVRPARLRAEKLGFSLDHLDRKLAPVSPIPQATKLKGKKVLLYLSRRDKIILYAQSIQTKNALEAAGVNLTYIENKHFGHIVTGYVNFSRHKVWLAFLTT